MRCILGFCVMFVVATPTWAQNNVPGQEPFYQQAGVRTSVPNIQATGAEAGTTQPSTMAPAATTTTSTMGYTAAPNTMAQPGNMTYYYYYPAANNGTVYYYPTVTPTAAYSTNYAPVYSAGTKLLHDGSPGLPVWTLPSEIRPARLYHDSVRYAANFLHESRLTIIRPRPTLTLSRPHQRARSRAA